MFGVFCWQTVAASGPLLAPLARAAERSLKSPSPVEISPVAPCVLAVPAFSDANFALDRCEHPTGSGPPRSPCLFFAMSVRGHTCPAAGPERPSLPACGECSDGCVFDGRPLHPPLDLTSECLCICLRNSRCPHNNAEFRPPDNRSWNVPTTTSRENGPWHLKVCGASARHFVCLVGPRF